MEESSRQKHSLFQFPIPDSRFPNPDSRFPIPQSRLPLPYSPALASSEAGTGLA